MSMSHRQTITKLKRVRFTRRDIMRRLRTMRMRMEHNTNRLKSIKQRFIMRRKAQFKNKVIFDLIGI